MILHFDLMADVFTVAFGAKYWCPDSEEGF